MKTFIFFAKILNSKVLFLYNCCLKLIFNINFRIVESEKGDFLKIEINGF